MNAKRLRKLNRLRRKYLAQVADTQREIRESSRLNSQDLSIVINTRK